MVFYILNIYYILFQVLFITHTIFFLGLATQHEWDERITTHEAQKPLALFKLPRLFLRKIK